ncbi:MAG: hypothetical protein AMXMBFR58_29480 [Phycisphaerae bacterium]
MRLVLKSDRETKAEVAAQVSFFQSFPETPDSWFEINRVILSPQLARRVVDMMTRTLNYYPTKPSEPATAET